MRRTLPLALAVAALVFAMASPSADARKRRAGGHGYLELQSTTKGATVFVDGDAVGTIPLGEPLRLPVGKHTLKIIQRGYTQFLDVFTIDRRRTTKLEIDLLPVAGVFVVGANVDEARVYVDGKFMGTTPLEAEALIGKRAIRVRKAGYYDFLVTKQAIAGKTQSVEAVLKPLPVGSTPYRPAPPPRRKWYEKWYVWAGVAGGVAAVALTVTLSVSLASQNEIDDFGAAYRWRTTPSTP